MTLFKRLRVAFAAAALSTAALPAQAQETAPVETSAQKPFALADQIDAATRDGLYQSSCRDKAQQCWTPESFQAMKLREMQQAFMASAVNCRLIAGTEDMLDRYDQMRIRHGKDFDESYFTMRRKFWESFGDGARDENGEIKPSRPGNAAADRLETGIANLYSGATGKTGYCAGVSGLLDGALAQPDGASLRAYAEKIMPPGPDVIPAASGEPAVPAPEIPSVSNPLPSPPPAP